MRGFIVRRWKSFIVVALHQAHTYLVYCLKKKRLLKAGNDLLGGEVLTGILFTGIETRALVRKRS